MNILGRIIKLKENGDFEYRSLVINIEIPRPEKTTTSAEKSAYPSARKLAHNNIVINNKDIIPNKIYNEKDAFINRLEDFKDNLGNNYQAFLDYWSEADAKGKMRYQDQKFFDITRRVGTWIKNSKNFEPNTATKIKLK